MRINKVYICLENEDTYTELSAPNILPLAADFPHPVPKVSTIDIIGGSGSLDISDAATGECNFQTVTGTISLVIPDGANVGATIDALYRKYHGKRCKVKFASAGKYRTGRIWVNEDDENRSKRVIKLTMNADPFWFSDKTETVSYATGQDVWNRNMIALQNAYLPTIGATYAYAICDFDGTGSYYAKFTLPEQSAVYMLSFSFYLDYNSGSGGSYCCDVFRGDTYERRIEFRNGDYAAIVVKPEDNLKLKFGIWTGNYGLSVRIGVYNIKLFKAASGCTVTNGGDISVIPTVTVSNGAATVYAESGEKHFNDGESGVFWDFPLSPGVNSFGIVPDTAGMHPTASFSFKEEYL